jgi:hypothetical protein
VSRTHTIAPSRLTLNVAEEAWSVGEHVDRGDLDQRRRIVVERACGGPHPATTGWRRTTPGEIVTGTRWAVAEGESGDRTERDYLPIANTSTFAGTGAWLLFEDGTTVEKVTPHCREQPDQRRADVDFRPRWRRYGALDRDAGRHAGPDRVERAMYSNANGIIWAAGTNALATAAVGVQAGGRRARRLRPREQARLAEPLGDT